jgi:integrase
VRPGELRNADWADIELDAADWRYTVPKTTTPHSVPLSRHAGEGDAGAAPNRRSKAK